MKSKILFFLLLFFLAGNSLATGSKMQLSESTEKRLEWFKDAKFGLFLVWGLYSVPEGVLPNGKPVKKYAEWYQIASGISASEYARLTEKFNPVKFDADELVKKAKNTGFKYITITAKFHDGFAMWPSSHSSFNIKLTPFHKQNPNRDLLMELRKACDKYGLKLVYYYSQVKDWHHYDAWHGQNSSATKTLFPGINEKQNHENYISKIMLPQLSELVGKYRADGIWFDTPGQWNNSRQLAERVVRTVRKINPDCLINSRLIHKSVNENSYWDLIDYSVLGDGGKGSFVNRPWYGETPAMGQMNTYSYHSQRKWHKPKLLISKLIHAVCNDYNFLLTVGQHADGSLPKEDDKVLTEIQKWMTEYSDAIHGTRGLPATLIKKISDNDLRLCSKSNKIYVFSNEQQTVSFEYSVLSSNKLKKVYRLTDKQEIQSVISGSKITFTPVLSKPGSYEVTVLEFEKSIQKQEAAGKK